MKSFLIALLLACAFGCAARAEGGDSRDAGWSDDGTADTSESDTDADDAATTDGAVDDGVVVPLPTAPRKVSCGMTHTCAISNAGDVRCWGYSYHGEVGGGLAGSVLTPSLPELTGADDVEAGSNQTCVLRAGRVYCWGLGSRGLLGDGVMPGPITVPKPTLIPGLKDVRQIGALGASVCALMADRTVKCWGWNLTHELGYETTTTCAMTGNPPCSAVPTPVPGVSNVAEVSFGVDFACVRIRDTGAISCWGNNLHGQLGDGTTVSRSEAREVKGLPPAARISAGVNQACALTTTGQVYCWGYAPLGSLLKPVTVPTPMTGFAGPVADVFPGGDGGCVLLSDGRVQCWGQFASPTPSAKPVTVDTIVDAIALCRPYNNTCAVTKSGEIYCWGSSLLGDGTTDGPTGVPRKVAW